MAAAGALREFKISVLEDQLADLKSRLSKTRCSAYAPMNA